MVIPHYANKTLEASKPFILANDEPMSWQWLNTVNRVNSQVKKVKHTRSHLFFLCGSTHLSVLLL